MGGKAFRDVFHGSETNAYMHLEAKVFLSFLEHVSRGFAGMLSRLASHRGKSRRQTDDAHKPTSHHNTLRSRSCQSDFPCVILYDSG